MKILLLTPEDFGADGSLKSRYEPYVCEDKHVVAFIEDGRCCVYKVVFGGLPRRAITPEELICWCLEMKTASWGRQKPVAEAIGASEGHLESPRLTLEWLRGYLRRLLASNPGAGPLPGSEPSSSHPSSLKVGHGGIGEAKETSTPPKQGPDSLAGVNQGQSGGQGGCVGLTSEDLADIEARAQALREFLGNPVGRSEWDLSPIARLAIVDVSRLVQEVRRLQILVAPESGELANEAFHADVAKGDAPAAAPGAEKRDLLAVGIGGSLEDGQVALRAERQPLVTGPKPPPKLHPLVYYLVLPVVVYKDLVALLTLFKLNLRILQLRFQYRLALKRNAKLGLQLENLVPGKLKTLPNDLDAPKCGNTIQGPVEEIRNHAHAGNTPEGPSVVKAYGDGWKERVREAWETGWNRMQARKLKEAQERGEAAL